MAMLFITHDLGIVRRIADDVCVMQRGRIVEAGRRRDVFAAPRHPYTRMLLAAEPKGEPPPVDRSAPSRSSRRTTCASGSRSARGFLRRTVGHVKAVDGVSLDGARGRDGRRRRRIRLGQDDARPRDAAPHPLEGPIVYCGRGIDGLDGEGRCGRLRRDMQIVFQDPFGSLSPRLSVAEIVEEGLIAQKTRLNARRAPRGASRGALADTGLDPATHGPLPARVLRRPAPAHRHRPRDGARAEIRRARRADLGARHVGAGADRRSAARPAAAARARLSVHHPRSARWCGRWRARSS